MASPFSIFRTHQRVLTVALTGLAMFAFIIMDQLRPEHFPVILGFLGGAALFWAIGSASGRGIPYAIAGGILGVVAGYFVPGMIDRDEIVETNFGDLSGRELEELRHQRNVANQFVSLALVRSGGQPPNAAFGSVEPETIAQDWVLHHKAEQMGVQLGETAVFEFIKQITDNRLTQEAFTDIRRQLKVSEDDLVEAIAYELETDMARRLAQPFQFRPPSQLAQFDVPLMPATPEQYWDFYERMTVEQQVAVAEIPVEAFIDPKAQPSQAELAELFEQYKEVYPGQRGPGEPGFRQPAKAQVAYFQADFDQMAETVPQPTEEEMRAYYEEHKDQFRKPASDPFASELQDLMRQAGEDEGPVAAPRPPDANPAPAQPPAETPTTPPNPPGPALPQPDAPQPPQETPPTPPGDDSSAAVPENLDGVTVPVVLLQEDDQSVAAPNPGAAPKPDAAQAPPSETAPPEPPPLPAPGDAAPPAPEITPAKVEYQPFEEVKDQIRRQLHEQAVRETLEKKIDAAIREMARLGQDYRAAQSGVGGTTLTPEKIKQELQKYEKQHGLRFVVTPLMTQQELAESDQYTINEATDPQTQRPVLPRIYEDERELLYSPVEAVRDFQGDRYAVWKMAYVPERVPESYEEVKEQVVKAWRTQKALPKARKRAEELAKSVNQDESLTDALAGKTVTGAETGEPLVVKQSQPFTWLTRQSLGQMPFGSSDVRLTNLDVVDLAGPEFMETVFDTLDEGETGVAPNYPRTKFYVAQVTSREAAQPEEVAQLRQRFLAEEQPFGQTLDPAGNFVIPSAYQMLLSQEQLSVVNAWARRLFDEEYGFRISYPTQDEPPSQ